mmetsp:Transcript_27596/g.65535  ORF Transcript_27596/g.65535 Transcript_27596/m.65535 type:complete len:223 (-) Transcript_27596:328-996(-)
MAATGVTARPISWQELPTHKLSADSSSRTAVTVQNGGANHIVAVAKQAPKPTNRLKRCSFRSSKKPNRLRDVSPSPPISRKVSVSGILLRPHIEIAPGIAEIRNGMRQPHSSICWCVSELLSNATKTLAKAHAIWLPTEIMHTAMPKVFTGETSTRYEDTAPISPPADNPCKALQQMRNTKPKSFAPPRKYLPGRSPWPTVATIIPPRERFTESLRPMLSAM